MAGQPGDGCDNPRDVHPHWCWFCGEKVLFSSVSCARLRVVPPCPNCEKTDWRDTKPHVFRKKLTQ